MSKFTSTIERALGMPSDAGIYYLALQLAREFPSAAVKMTTDCDFDVGYFLRYGLGEGAETERVWRLTKLWSGRPMTEETIAAWHTVRWNGDDYQIVTANFEEIEHHFLVGPTRQAVDRFFSHVCAFHGAVDGEVLVHANGRWERDEAFDRALMKATWDRLVLESSLIEELRHQVEDFFAGKERYQRHRIAWKRGLLFVGPPGNGKTQAIRALANEARRRVLVVRNMLDFYGDPKIDGVFRRIRRTSPCIVVLEDLDSLIPSGSLSEALNELDGAKGLDGVLFLATTNHPDRLDPALKNRPSRFDRIYEFAKPNGRLRERFFKQATEEIGEIGERELREVVAATKGMSFAMLQEVVVSASFHQVHSPSETLGATLLRFAELVHAQFAGKGGDSATAESASTARSSLKKRRKRMQKPT